MNCRTFYIDEIVFDAYRNNKTTSLRALSTQASVIYSAIQYKQYLGKNFADVAQEIASVLGYTVKGNISGIVNANCKSDVLSFLFKQACILGKVMKIEDKSIIFEQLETLKQGTSYTIKADDCIKWNATDKAMGRYVKCTCQWLNIKTGQLVSGSYAINGKGSEAVIWQECKDNNEANEQAKNWLEDKAKQAANIELTLVGDVRLRAGVMLQLSGFGKFDTKWIIDEARHTVNKYTGYATVVKLRI